MPQYWALDEAGEHECPRSNSKMSELFVFDLLLLSPRARGASSCAISSSGRSLPRKLNCPTGTKWDEEKFFFLLCSFLDLTRYHANAPVNLTPRNLVCGVSECDKLAILFAITGSVTRRECWGEWNVVIKAEKKERYFFISSLAIDTRI